MKEKRDRLFKRGRPLVRPLEIYDKGSVHRDIGLLWVSYKNGKFFADFPKGLSESEFLSAISGLVGSVEFFVVDDLNKEYNGFGPIAVVSVSGNGWKYVPHTVFFPWATNRNKLTSTVAFMQMVRYKNVGCCLVHALKESKHLFDKVCEYGVLEYVGRLKNGDERGDEYLYSTRGKRK